MAPKNQKQEVHDQTVVTLIPEMEREKHAYIIFLSGPLVGKIHLLEEGTITLGRGADVDIPINDLGISRHHASIKFRKGKTVAVLKDLGSTNGTYLNGHKIQEAEIADGDHIQFSSATILKYAYQDKIENVFHSELYKMAVVDALTGAHNKRYFEERMKEEFSYAFRNQVPLSLLMMDIDHFKKVNDTYGHPAGDFVLSQVASLAKSIVRQEDVLARVGGEEFAVILKSSDSRQAVILAERMRRLIEQGEFEFEGNKIQVTVSIGSVTMTDRSCPDWEVLIKRADELLYKSKHEGRNRVSS